MGSYAQPPSKTAGESVPHGMGLLKAACAEGGTRIRSCLVKVAPSEYDGVLAEYDGVLGARCAPWVGGSDGAVAWCVTLLYEGPQWRSS
jgi:hypothetical protein